jgi:hypothetical protein
MPWFPFWFSFSHELYLTFSFSVLFSFLDKIHGFDSSTSFSWWVLLFASFSYTQFHFSSWSSMHGDISICMWFLMKSIQNTWSFSPIVMETPSCLKFFNISYIKIITLNSGKRFIREIEINSSQYVSLAYLSFLLFLVFVLFLFFSFSVSFSYFYSLFFFFFISLFSFPFAFLFISSVGRAFPRLKPPSRYQHKINTLTPRWFSPFPVVCWCYWKCFILFSIIESFFSF